MSMATTASGAGATFQEIEGSGRLQLIEEMEEFGNLPTAAQRYIRRSLEIRFGRLETVAWIARSPTEARSINRQIMLYDPLDQIRAAIPSEGDLASVLEFVDRLAPLAAFDLGEQQLESFDAFRFLYERLLGAAVRPWLPAVFMMIVSLPGFYPNRRIDLLGSIAVNAVVSHWSMQKPLFHPQWIEDVEETSDAIAA